MVDSKLVIKAVIFLCNLYGTVSESLFVNVAGLIIDEISDCWEDASDKIKKELIESVRSTVSELDKSVQTESFQYILEEKEAQILYAFKELEKRNAGLGEYKKIVDKIFKGNSSFEVSIYTEKDYKSSAEIFFKKWLLELEYNEQASFRLIFSSIMNLYELLDNLGRKGKTTDNDSSPILLISRESKRPKNTFIKASREHEIEEMIQIINENDKVGIISGIGGIGKTEICKFLFHSCYNEARMKGVRYIGWLTYRNNLMQTLAEQVICDKDEENMEKAYQDALAYLQKLGPNLLLFVDNVDNSMVTDNKLKQLFDLNCKLVITTRIQEFNLNRSVYIGPLNEAWSKSLFYTFYLSEQNEECFQKIYAMTKGHPLSIELIAKTAQSMQHVGVTLEDIVRQLEESGFGLPQIDNTIVFEEYNQSLIGHLKRVFDISGLSGTYKNVMYRLSLFPVQSFKAEDLIEWKAVKCEEELELLANRGWIYLEADGVSMHPVIADAVCSKSSNSYSIYKSMIAKMVDILNLPGNRKPHELYGNMMIFKHVAMRKKFTKLEYAELLNQIGVICYRAGDYDTALILLKDAIRIKEKLNVGEEELFSCYNNLALIYGRRDLKSNLSYCKKAEAIGRRLVEKDESKYALKLATTLNNLSLSYLNNGRLEEAEKAQMESIGIKKAVEGEECVLLGQSYNNLAIVYKRKGDYLKAEEIQRASLNYKDAADYGVHLYNMAGIEDYLKKEKEAEKYLKEAIDVWREDIKFYRNELLQGYEHYLEILNREKTANTVKIETALKELEEVKNLV